MAGIRSISTAACLATMLAIGALAMVTPATSTPAKVTPAKELAAVSPAATVAADTSGLHGLGWLPSDVFDTGEGLPDPTVNAIAIQHSGQVWVGTMRGLARQSGSRMVAEHGPGDVLERQVLDLLVTADDTLLASVDSGGIWQLRNGHWSSLGSPFDERRTQRMRAFASGSGERVFAVGGGVAEFVDGQWRAWPLPASLAGREIFDIALEPTRAGQPQRIWLATFGAGLQRCDGDSCSPVSMAGSGPRTNEILTLQQQPRAGTSAALWVGMQGGGLARWQDDTWTRWHTDNSPLPSNFVADIELVAMPGAGTDAWIGTRDGLAVLRADGSWTMADPRIPQLGSRVRTLTPGQDSQGNPLIWIGTDAGAVRTPMTGAWRLMSTLGTRGNGVWGLLVEPVADGSERIWLASDGDGLQRFEAGQWHAYGAAEGLPEKTIRSILRVPDGSREGALWVGAWSGRVLRLQGDRFIEIPTPWAKNDNEAVSLLLANKDSVWISTRNQGIAHWDGRAWDWKGTRTGMPSRAYGAIRVGRDVWMSTADRGLARVRDGNWDFFGADIGIPSDALYDMHLIRDAGGRPVLWIGSNKSGLLRIDIGNPDVPRLVTRPALPPLPVPMVYGVVRDGSGDLLACTDYGVARLKRAGTGYQSIIYHRADGLPHDECNANAMQVDDRGRVWIGTVGGAAVYTPRTAGMRKPSPLLLSAVLVNGKRIPVPANGQPLVLPSRSSGVELQFELLTGEDEHASEYRVIAEEASGNVAWSNDNRHRLANLGDGLHEFRIEARDAMGTTAFPITFSIDVPQAWWRTPAARAAQVLAALGLFWLVLKWRERQLRRNTQRLSEMVQQRTTELKGREQELHQLNHELLRLSYTDPLTGLGNRRHLFETLAREWQGSTAASSPLSLLMLDLDHFKAFNDSHGHQAGDARLQQVAGILQSHLPPQALAARYGGEEFCVLLPGTDPVQAIAVAESLRAAIASLSTTGDQALLTGPATTASIGVATMRPSLESRLDDLIAEADQALYAAKHAGRNCIKSAAGSD
ncbi:diguanylate cyclase [Thermomonas sp.]|uniref:ligand-binding sensor domain-containing diguanylate cyclase n=1 Tax=Thermomonas sp. TaxID=1971895 RepID=UPI00248A00A3|nr:diguanylate cyclase [Thermomonas sp.]MDI1252995.1 diguanylate cyclase [Thermomonas sp.]